MKKYYLADLLTLLEVILASILLGMAFIGVSADYAIWVFVAGELCDAFDGPCARRWHYPNDGKYRWWRHYNEEIDQASDICLAVCCGIYLIWRVNTIIGMILLVGIGFCCAAVQWFLYSKSICDRCYAERHPDRAEAIILRRRKVYVYLGIGGAIVTFIFATSWLNVIKCSLIVVGIIIAVILTKFKRPRLEQSKTPL